MLEHALLARAAPSSGVAACLLGVTEDTFVPAGAGASRKIAAALEFGDLGLASNDPPAGVGACGDVVLGFVALRAVGYL